MPAPWFMLRLTIGKFANYLVCSQRVLPEAARRAGFEFRHPDLPSALRALFPPAEAVTGA
jgi:NAD dependent epimerase/dehydratase family enzyme